MATVAEVRNDLSAQAERLKGTGNDHLVKSLKRGVECIDTLLELTSLQLAMLERFADLTETKTDQP